jgi:hypothetical protein
MASEQQGHSGEDGGSVGAPAAQPAADRNALAQPDAHPLPRPAPAGEKCGSRPPGEIRFVGRQAGAFGDLQGHARSSRQKVDLIGEIDGLEDRAQLVEAVGARRPDGKPEIELRPRGDFDSVRPARKAHRAK